LENYPGGRLIKSNSLVYHRAHFFCVSSVTNSALAQTLNRPEISSQQAGNARIIAEQSANHQIAHCAVFFQDKWQKNGCL
jgi:hypothetical protein